MGKMSFFLIYNLTKDVMMINVTHKKNETILFHTVTGQLMASCKFRISFFESIPTFQLSWEISLAVY